MFGNKNLPFQSRIDKWIRETILGLCFIYFFFCQMLGVEHMVVCRCQSRDKAAWKYAAYICSCSSSEAERDKRSSSSLVNGLPGILFTVWRIKPFWGWKQTAVLGQRSIVPAELQLLHVKSKLKRTNQLPMCKLWAVVALLPPKTITINLTEEMETEKTLRTRQKTLDPVSH